MSQFLARRWRRQPQGAILIDWSNPITRGLSTVFLPSLRSPAIDLVTGVFDTATTKGSLLPRNNAIAYSVTGTNVAWSLNFAPVGIPSGYAAQSIFTLFEQYDTTTIGPIFGAGLNSGLYMRFEKNADGSVNFNPNSNSGGSGLTSQVLNTNQVYALAGVQQGSFREAFIDGVSFGSSSTSITFLNTGYGYAGSAFTTGRFRRVGIYCGYGWTRRLTPFEILSLTDNPWQLFAPQKTISYSLPELYTAIDEVISDRTDYIESSTAGQIYETTLQPVAQPDANTNIDFNFEADSPDDAGSLKFDLLSGQTVVKSQTVSLVRNWAGRLRSPRPRQQPQGNPQIDWSNPLTRGLATVVLPINANHRDLISGATDTAQYRAPMGAKSRGLALSNTNGGNPWSTLIAIPNVAGGYAALTTFCLYEQPDTTTYGAVFGAGYDGTYYQGFTKNTDGTVTFSPATNSGGLTITTAALATNKAYALCGIARYDQNLRQLYVDGVSVGTNTASGTLINGQFAFMGSVYQGGRDRCLSVYAFYCWTRELSAAEVRSVTENPWQIFRPPPAHAVSYVRPLDTTIAVTPSDYSVIDTPQVGRFLPQRWRQQPQGVVQVDWSNPLTRGLVFAWEGSGGARNNVDGRFATTATSGVNSGTARGLARQWDGTQASASYTWGTTYFPVAGATKVSMEAMVSISSLAGERKLISKWSGIYSLLLSVANTGQLIGAVGNGGSTLNAYQTNSSVISANNSLKYLVAVWRGGNNWDFYVDGVKQSGISSISSGAVASVGNASGVNFQLVRDDVGGPLNGALVFARVRNVDLSDLEVFALAQNPWQIFKPNPGHLYGLPPAGGWPWTPTLKVTSL